MPPRPTVALHARLQRVVAGDLDGARGAKPQDVHDHGSPVEVGQDRVEFLLFAQGDTGLEVVVGRRQEVGLATVAGRAVGAREAVERSRRSPASAT